MPRLARVPGSDLAEEARDEAARARAIALRPPEQYQQPPVIGPWRCVTCRGEWTLHPSSQLGYCSRCGTDRPRGDA